MKSPASSRIKRVARTAVTIVLLLLINLIFVVKTLDHYPAVIDDAYISFRYAANFAEGKGLVFNPGERVEGFSNFLWTLIIAIAMRLFHVDPMFFAKILGMLASIGLIITSYLASRMVLGRWSLVNFIPPLIIAGNTYLAHWSVMGLATSAFVFMIFLTMTVAFAEHKYRWRFQVSPILAALTIMMRIDGSFFLGIMFAVFWLILITRGEFTLRRWGFWMLEFLIIMIPYMTWRLLYYASLFPNPYYAKVDPNIGHSRGLAHVFYFMFDQGWGFFHLWLVPVLVSVFWRTRYGLICLVMVALTCFFVWYVNGDWMPNYRFLLPMIPFIALNVTVVVRLVTRIKKLPATLLLYAFLLIAVYDYGKFHFHQKSIYIFDWNPHNYPQTNKKWFYPSTMWQSLWQGYVPPLQNVADWIFANVPDGSLVSTSDIGYPGFLNLGVHIIDIDGLTDRFIGRLGNEPESHQKRRDYIMERNPEFAFIFINHSRPDPTSPGHPYPEVSRLMHISTEFRNNYVEVSRMNKYMNSWVHLYKRKDARSGLTNEEQIQRLEEGLRRNPRVFYLYITMMNLCRQEGKPREVWLPYVRRALDLFRGNAENMRRLADRLTDVGELDLAATAYARSLCVNPRQPVLYTVLADLYVRTKQPEKAIDVLEKGTTVFPNNSAITYSLKRIKGQE